MSSIFILLITILSVVFAIWFLNYICTLPERRKSKEKRRREILLCQEQFQAEKAKQIARIAGEYTRKNIDKIANRK